MMRTKIIVTLGMLTASASAMLFDAAIAQEYCYAWFAKNPKAWAAYKKLVPTEWQKVAWLSKLNGGANSPIEKLTYSGKPFYRAVLNENSNFSNNASILVAADGSQAFAVVHTSTFNHGKLIEKTTYLGNPQTDAKKILDQE